MANFDALVSRRIFFARSKWIKKGALVKASFKSLKLCLASVVNINFLDFTPFFMPLSSLKRPIATPENPCTKRR